MAFVNMRRLRDAAVATLGLKVMQQICNREATAPCLPYSKTSNSQRLLKKQTTTTENLGSVEMMPLSAKLLQIVKDPIPSWCCDAELAVAPLGGGSTKCHPRPAAVVTGARCEQCCSYR